ncbi:CopM family metallochaperone [Falsiroseomonas sp. E2-1-a20]|uniref:CopM family metallochaperone n=1 Tax=Falsiroseomonas sp. E2-1-a20 TaxID=3239300 RepID=UPI003F3D0F3A
MTRLARSLALAAGLAGVSAAGLAIAQGTAPQPQPAQPGQPGMMGQMPGMQQHMQHMQHMQQRMMPGAQTPGSGAAQAPAATDPHQHGAAVPGTAAQSPSTVAFMAANEKMHRDMAITFTGDADRDFAASMIPHHEGAIAMARVQLAHGRDQGMRSLAEAVIHAQESEIASLRAFLARPR